MGVYGEVTPCRNFWGPNWARPQCENVPVTLSTLLKTTKLSRFEKVIKGTCDWPNGARPQCENVLVTLSTFLKTTILSRFRKVIKGTYDWLNGSGLQCDGLFRIFNYSIKLNLHSWGFVGFI